MARQTALQNRVASLLSASFADLDIRDALGLLDARGVSNSADTRRRLRLDLHEELIQCNGAVITDFGAVAAQLRRVGAAIDGLGRTWAAVRKHVDAANRETGPMLGEAGTILAERDQVQTKRRLLDAAAAHFVLSDAEQDTLSAHGIDDDFFRVVTRLKQIHTDSQVLLGAENQRLGLEVLEQSSRQLNSAYHKLYRWLSREFKNQVDLENAQVNAAMRRPLRVLAERPALFNSMLDSIAESRESSLSTSFYTALTGPKAIELTAHDPLRYVSDMLAWTRSATVSEREALYALLITDSDQLAAAPGPTEPWVEAEHFNPDEILQNVLTRSLEGVFRQVRTRTDQVIQAHQDAVLAYSIANLVRFYMGVFTPLLGSSDLLSKSLRPIIESAMRTFKSVMLDRIQACSNSLESTSADLAPPEFLYNALTLLRRLVASYETTVALPSHDEPVRGHEEEDGLEPILTHALYPSLDLCEDISKHLTSPKREIFLLNCLLATRDAIPPHLLSLEPKISSLQNHLISSVYEFMLATSGIGELVDEPGEYHKQTLKRIAEKLDLFLPTAFEDVRLLLSPLRSGGREGDEVISNATDKFCTTFEQLESKLTDEEKEIFPRTGDEIRVLLS
ncbi:oligomeric complex COG6 [Piedraia hortae CBS 480.64]|uniref:Conserved oligomeric Golgi complex subunit 6 n=1 Tax=Piedraia hortae CBS 480.64 TaxID=1314780 RepID=A0A6A7C4P6_9PEZI|nr:oligomeric complex COG6 [Piedraia hortae CBS 480.64]